MNINNVNIDTLNISFDIEQLVNMKRYKEDKRYSLSSSLDELLDRLDQKEKRSGDGYTIWRGKLRNYSVEISNNKITLFGSLCKFYHGDNLKSLTLEETKVALKLLAMESGLPILSGNIMRIDIGVNLSVTQPLKNYLNLFEETPKWIKNLQPAGVTYNKGNQAFCIYDKKKELFRNSLDVHHLIRDDNILRAECRFKKGLRHIFKYEKPIKVIHLLSSSFRNAIALKFIKQYLSLNTKLNWKFSDVNDVSDIKNLIYYLGIESLGGRKIFMEKINDIRKLKKWEYNKTATVRQWVDRVLKNTSAIHQVDLSEEINKKIASAIYTSDLFTLDENETSPSALKSIFSQQNWPFNISATNLLG